MKSANSRAPSGMSNIVSAGQPDAAHPKSSMPQAPGDRSYFSHDGLRLAYLDSAPGDTQRPAVLMLHGFPDTADLWASQIAVLHGQGFRVIAPDIRGFGHSDIPQSRKDHHLDKIIADQIALMDQLDIKMFDLVGHDWGAVLAWILAGRHPTRVKRLVALSVGHPTAYARAGLAQKIAGWYIGYFLIPGLGERLLLRNGLLGLRKILAPYPDADEVIHRFSRPGRLTAALRIYRANIWDVLFLPHPKPSVPTFGIWSSGDRFLTESQMLDSENWVDSTWRYEKLPGSHWIPTQQSERLNELLLSYLAPDW